MIHILYSADYELYLGGLCLPEEEVLIHPTEHLLATCDRLGIPLTLFADMACLWRYRELGLDHFPTRAETQLQNATQRGHDVQTHLHPHWAFTRFEGQHFHFNNKHYLLGTVDPDPAVRLALTKTWLQRAANSLTQLIAPLVPSYQCVAFRAGGYGLQPDTPMILKALQETGYRIDSSIIPGARMTTNVQQVDFTQLPTLPNYWLSEQQGLSYPAPPGTGLFEIPMAACPLTRRDRLILQTPEAARQSWAILRGIPPTPPRGHPCNTPSSTPLPGTRWHHAYWRAQALMNVNFLRLELGTNPKTLLTCVRRYLEKYYKSSDETIFFALNCHPKGIHQTHLDTLASFHAALTRHYQHDIQAITFQQAWQIIQKNIREF